MGLSPCPQLSVCVPSYNVQGYLPEGLATYADERLAGLVEVVVVDDGSTDATREVAEGFATEMPEVFRVVSQPNGGHGAAVNAGLAAARGRYFRVIDADDWVDTEALLAFATRLKGLSCDLVVDVKTEVDMLTLATERFDLPEDAPLDRDVPFEEVCGDATLVPYLMIHTLTCRTERLRSMGLFLLEHTFYEDFEYVVKASVDARSLRFVNLAVYHYLVGNANQSVADANYVRRWDDHTRVTNEVLRLCAERGDLSAARRAYLRTRAQLIIATHYNIALVFDPDRARGLARAREFRWKLERDHPELAALTARRYRAALVLHRLGVRSQGQLDAITARLKR